MSDEKNKDPKLDALAATRLLENVFDECDVEPNTVPMEALSAYSGYRKERFFLQRLILAVAIILFLLLPFLFVDIDSVLPVGYVTASLDGKAIPVYEADSHTYMVEPTRNGTLEIEVSLFNAQKVKKTIKISGIDEDAPSIKSSKAEDGRLKLYVEDGKGDIDYETVYATDKNGETIKPLSYNKGKGEIVLPYPDSDWDVYISDVTGNTLHLKINKK